MQGTLTDSFDAKLHFKHWVLLSIKQNYHMLQVIISSHDYDVDERGHYPQKLVPMWS